MKVFPQCIVLALAALIASAVSGCKPKPRDRPATVSTVEKEKHTKSKAHAREKKKEKSKDGKKPAKATPAKSA